MQSCFTDSSSCPDGATPLPAGVTAADDPTSLAYAVQATSTTGTSYRITRSGGEYFRTCGMGPVNAPLVAPPGSEGGCDAGSW